MRKSREDKGKAGTKRMRSKHGERMEKKEMEGGQIEYK